jgi:hypothetical protein
MQPDGITTNFAPQRGGVERDPQTISTHYFYGANSQGLLENTAVITTTARREGDQLIVNVSVTNEEGGHHIPTGSPLRQIFLVVTATDEQGQTLALQTGPRLPDWSGDLSGLPGIYFAKILGQQWTGMSPTVAYWTPTQIIEDTRLPARATNISTYAFVAPGNGRITNNVQLVFRRAYYDLMQQKGWDTPDILMENINLLVQ